MTPVLQKIVEAMVVEVSRQVYTDYTTEDPSPEPFVNDLVVDGRIDLEKVARAALAAIRPPDPIDMLDMTHKGSFPEYALRGAIDAILEDQPSPSGAQP